jgi:hypothetical protein
MNSSTIIVSLTHFLNPLWALAFFLTAIVLILIAHGLSVYIAVSNDFDAMLRALSGSKAVPQFRQMSYGGSLRSKIMLISLVSALFIWPQYFIGRGLLDTQDFETFPSRLRKRILISTWVNIIGAACLAIAAGMVWIIRL